MLSALIEAGADLNAGNRLGVTPLLQAARTGDARMIRLLLDGGASPDAAVLEGETPLMSAARTGSIDAVNLLLGRLDPDRFQIPVSVEPARARLEELLEEFSVTHLRDAPAVSLSGGERRRVEIARALATDARVVVIADRGSLGRKLATTVRVPATKNARVRPKAPSPGTW